MLRILSQGKHTHHNDDFLRFIQRICIPKSSFESYFVVWPSSPPNLKCSHKISSWLLALELNFFQPKKIQTKNFPHTRRWWRSLCDSPNSKNVETITLEGSLITRESCRVEEQVGCCHEEDQQWSWGQRSWPRSVPFSTAMIPRSAIGNQWKPGSSVTRNDFDRNERKRNTWKNNNGRRNDSRHGRPNCRHTRPSKATGSFGLKCYRWV